MPHIAVIGAGITGITSAYALLDRGYDVTVLDRQRYAGMETSYANGGQLSASNAEVWNGWPTLLKGAKWLFRADAPLKMNLAPSWHKYSWLAEFVANIPHAERNTVETAKLAIAARAPLLAMARRENIAFDLEKRGILHVYRDKAGFDHALKVNAILRKGGLDRRPVTPDEMRAIEPALTGTFHGGVFTESDFTGDIHAFTRGLAEACRRRGARLLLDAGIERIERLPDGRFSLAYSGGAEPTSIVADAVVVAAGTGSRALAAQLGDRVNIYPVKGYSITLDLDGPSRAAAPWVSLLDDGAKIVSSRLGAGRLRVAGTAEFNGANQDIRADRVRPLVDWTRRLFPGVETSRAVPWAGLRPMMPDMLPRVGPGRLPGVFYNTGHGHLGWTLSAATAEILARSVEVAMPAEARHTVPGWSLAA